MNKFILSTAAALMLTATTAYSAPVSTDHNVLDSMTEIKTMPLAQKAQELPITPELDQRELSRINYDIEAFDDSPDTIRGFWKSES